MTEVNLVVPVDAATAKSESEVLTPMQEMNEALKKCNFGIFHLRLLLTAFIGYVAASHVTSTSAYLLPVAECDLHMDLVQKGFLNAVPYLGMLFSSIASGFLTDTFGRKMFLVGGNLGIFIFTIIGATSQSYEVLATAKLFEGMFFAMAFSPTLTLTSEFCHSGIRDRVMLFQSSFAAIGMIITALVAWGTLKQNWNYRIWDYELHIWNFYLFVCSSWSLGACILYSFIPESPKYWLAQKNYDKAREVLKKVYAENTRNPVSTANFDDLWKKVPENPEQNNNYGFRHQIVTSLYKVKPIFRKPLGIYLLLLCLMAFLTLSTYNIIRLWYPQLSTIIEHSTINNKNSTQNLCEMLDEYTSNLNMRKLIQKNNTIVECVPNLSGDETYINTITIGLVSGVPFIITGVLVNKVGKKVLLFTCGAILSASLAGLRWSNSKFQVVALFAVGTALSQSMISLAHAVNIETFPTSSRTLAMSIMMFCGRVGTLLGNVSFPILLSLACEIPFYCLAAVMLCVSVMSIFLPKKEK